MRILISGAARGVGFACAHALSDLGAEVILCDSDEPGLARAGERLGCPWRFCDVISDSSVEIFAANIAATYPSIDVLINAAGQNYVRSLGMVRLSRGVLPLLRKASSRPLIINIAPTCGFLSAGQFFSHAGSQEGFELLSSSLIRELRGTSIAVVNTFPQFECAQAAKREPHHNELYYLPRIDEDELVDRIVALIGELEPGERSLPRRVTQHPRQ